LSPEGSLEKVTAFMSGALQAKTPSDPYREFQLNVSWEGWT